MRSAQTRVAFVLLVVVWSGVCFALLMLPSVLAQGSRPPLCDVTCGPDPGSPSYGGTMQARPLPHNSRGFSISIDPPAPGGPRPKPPAPGPLPAPPPDVLPGSESYNYAIPILYLPGRNGLDLNLTLYYNSRVWTIDKVNGTASFNADRDFPSYGFRLGFGYIEGPFPNVVGTQSYLLTEPDGSKRELRQKSGTTDVFESFDSSYIEYNSTGTWKLLQRKDGARWWYQQVGTSTFYRPGYIEDTNGNYLTIIYRDDLFPNAPATQAQAINTIIDTLGRVVTFNYDANKKLTSITGPAFGTGTRTFATFTWATRRLRYTFSLSVVDSPPSDASDGTSDINVLTACTYTNGTGYVFHYNGETENPARADWGIVNKIEQKSSSSAIRSYVSYNYPAGTVSQSDHPTFNQQSVFDGANTAPWAYAVTKISGLVSSFAITDPVGTTTTTNLYTAGWQTGLVSSVTIQSGGATLRTLTNTWTSDPDGSNPRLASLNTTLDDSQQAKVEFSYTSYGNVSELREYDYGPLLKRRTQTDYVTNASYINRHILDRPTQVRVYDGGGVLRARSDLGYDSTSLTSVPGAAQHDDSGYGSGFLTRGNLTGITRYTNAAAASGPITRNFYYDTLGNLLKADLDCCQQRQWGFTSNTQYAYPETITSGPPGTQLTVSRTYDFATGLVTSATNENLKTTQFGYDSMNRISMVIPPDQVQLPTYYDDASAQPAFASYTPLDGTNSLIQRTYTDGFGRPVTQDILNGAGAGYTLYSSVNIQYDPLGRATQVSNPHAPSESPVWTYNTYDALSRITQVTPPGSAGSYQYNYTSQVGGSQSWCPGTAVTVTDPTGKQRRTCSDAFGRLVQVHEPGYADGASGSGWVTINGAEQSKVEDTCPGDPFGPCLAEYWDDGQVSITVDGFTATATFGQGSTTSSIAADLRAAFNTSGASPVTASGTGATINFVAKQAGVQTNYSLSVAWTWDSGNFTNPSFTATKSGNTLTGGADGATGTPSINTPLVTVYNYDALDNLTQVIQGVQTRTFNYDSLSRLTSATTPEAGTVSYTYTNFSQVATRTDPRTVVTTYSYDPLNRLIQVSYNDGTPGVTFTYGTSGTSNNNGRLTQMSDGLGSESYSYDILGRITQVNRVIDGVSYPISYGYNLASELTSITYPSGRVVTQGYDPIGRLNLIASQGTNYLSSVQYNAASEPTSFNYGNGVAATFSYNTRMQLASLRYSMGAADLLNLTYNYGSGNNGQIQSITDNLDASRTASYTYDPWARLKTAQTSQWGLSWDYDRYGNRKNQNVTAGSAPAPQLTINPSTNRITDTGFSYDLAGNMTQDGLNTYSHDAENRIKTVNGTAATYSYDGAGLRAKKVAGAQSTVYIFSGTKVIAEYVNGAAVNAPTREYIYAGSQLLATIEGGATKYHHPDHLSTRVITDGGGSVVAQRGHFPFGEVWYETGTPDKWKFTSYERDPESLLDYAMFRYHASRLGRFMTPDPIAGSVLDPQSLNRYSYTRNDPVNLIDPLGLEPFGCTWSCVSTGDGRLICTKSCPAPLDPGGGGLGPGGVPDRGFGADVARFWNASLQELWGWILAGFDPANAGRDFGWIPEMASQALQGWCLQQLDQLMSQRDRIPPHTIKDPEFTKKGDTEFTMLFNNPNVTRPTLESLGTLKEFCVFGICRRPLTDHHLRSLRSPAYEFISIDRGAANVDIDAISPHEDPLRHGFQPHPTPCEMLSRFGR